MKHAIGKLIRVFVIPIAYAAFPTVASGQILHNDNVNITGNLCAGSANCTGNPPQDVTVADSDPDIRFTDTTTGDAWQITGNEDNFQIRSRPAGGLIGTVVDIDFDAPLNSLVVDSSGRVGLGIAAPTDELTIAFTSPSVKWIDTNGSKEWDIDANSSGFFIVEDNANTRMTVDTGGNVGIGTTSPASMLHVTGDARIEGDVALGSSREFKTELTPVEPTEVLARLVQLPIQTWRYKEDSRGARHLGPVAEDFFSLFGLGSDEKHISAVDTSGVAFAAIQALNGEMETLRAQNKGLRVMALVALLTSVFSLVGLTILGRRL